MRFGQTTNEREGKERENQRLNLSPRRRGRKSLTQSFLQPQKKKKNFPTFFPARRPRSSLGKGPRPPVRGHVRLRRRHRRQQGRGRGGAPRRRQRRSRGSRGSRGGGRGGRGGGGRRGPALPPWLHPDLQARPLPRPRRWPPPRSHVGTAIDAKVVQVDAAGRKLILSERAASLASLAGAIGAGDVLTGVVTRLCDYGAFVSLQSPGDGGLHGAEGLIHLSELSWDAVLTPEAVVQPGTVVRVRVLGADAERGRIRLSLKRMEADPLTETLDALLPLSAGGGGGDGDSPSSSAAERVDAGAASTAGDGGPSGDASPALVPTSIEGVCAALRAEPGVAAVKLGRQAEEKRAVSQDLELWISRAVVAVSFFF